MPDYSQFEKVLARQDGRLLTLSFNRPERRNAVGGGLHEDLDALIALVRKDDSVGAVLLRGEGQAFCAGGDIKEMSSGEPTAVERVGSILGSRELLYSMLEIQQPIIAAVQGFALGLGATIALFCDIVVAAEDAYFADTHVNVGLVAGDGGAVLWPLLLPFGQAKYHLLTGDRITGSDAARMGMIHKAVPADQLLEEATAIARRLADGPTLALKWTKKAVNQVLRERLDLVLDIGLALEGATFTSDDFKEASSAFIEKRKPTFTGR
ncbi:MAG: enoyl-CoA hydratase/isomerase family protein [Acidimicrobiales bacterium]|jgi:enoyl-CoA hydratase